MYLGGIFMVKYDKKILYLDYYQNNLKIKNVGFAKINRYNQECYIELTIKGIELRGTIYGVVLLCTSDGEEEIGQLHISLGNGRYVEKMDVMNMGGLNITYEQCFGIKVIVDKENYILAQWKDVLSRKEEVELTYTSKEETIVVEVVEEIAEGEREAVEDRESNVQGKIEFSEKEIGRQLEDNKWKQLCKNYTFKYPFGDERSYLSITPEDFVILTHKYQVLVNNSFLLHGYYNYRHLLLGRVVDEEEKYYIGVPGVFYEREKEVALMFGFESFECAKEPAETGSFGYYMKRVEI